MKIQKFFGIDGAKQAEGTTVIIDIFRAATVSAYLLSKGADKILPDATKDDAFKYKATHPEWLLVGEEMGIKVNGFDYGNSPFEISKTNDIKGKTIVHRSSMGTQGIVNAVKATQIIFGSFTTCSAVARHICNDTNQTVSIIAMDGEGSEDDLYANYLIAKLQDRTPQHISEIIEYLKDHPGGARFLDPKNKEFPEEDFHLCLELDKFDFVPILKDGFVVKHSMS